MGLFSNFFNKNEKSSPTSQNQDVKSSQEIASLIGCKCTAISKDVSATELTQMFISELENGKKMGYYPVILTPEENLLKSIQISFEDKGGIESFQETLLNNTDVSHGEKILKERFNERLQELSDYNIYGEYSKTVKYSELTPESEMFLAKIPTDKPWKIFAWVPFGNWNECPDAEDMMSVCKYWYEKYGALPAVITSDTMQFYIPSPVKDLEDALHIAEEQYAFCYDSVEQGTETIKALASTIVDSNVWSFWWD